MSTLAPTKKEIETNSLPAAIKATPWVSRFVNSTVGGKILVALTGAGLTGFVIVHLLGNLKIFAGRESLNAYAQFLKDLGPGLWIARLGLLTFFVAHIFLALRLKYRSQQARPVAYAHQNTVQASLASRTMAQTGVIILVYLLLHLAHFTFGFFHQAKGPNDLYVNLLELKDSQGRHDVYTMMVAGFTNPIMAIIYIVAQLFLLVHLSHGVASIFQSLGLNSPRFQPYLRILGWGVALFVALGNIAIVVAVWSGMVPH